jgi:hypothetical protein
MASSGDTSVYAHKSKLKYWLLVKPTDPHFSSAEANFGGGNLVSIMEKLK